MKSATKFMSFVGLDGDGCVLKARETFKDFLERNDGLIEDIFKRSKDAAFTKITSFSKRQFFNTEFYGNAKNENGMLLIALHYIKDALQKRGLKNVEVDDFLLEDVFSNALHGTTAKKIYSALGIQDKDEIKAPAPLDRMQFFPEIYKKPSLLFKNIKPFVEGIFCDYKIFILYAMHHKIRQDHPEYSIRSAVYDDIKNILFGANAFNQKLPFLPPDCMVDFCLYDHGNNIRPTVKCASISNEKALADADYPSTIIYLTQLSSKISRKIYMGDDVDDFLEVLDLSKMGPLMQIMQARNSERQSKDKMLTNNAEKNLLKLYIKVFSSCPDLEEVVVRFKNLLGKEENDFLLKIAKHIYDIILSPQISYDAYEENISSLKQRDPQLFDLISKLKEKSQIESHKLIIQKGDISKDTFPANHDFLMFLKKWASTTRENVPEYVVQLFLELRTASSPKHLLNRMRFVYLPMIVNGNKEFFRHFEIAYRILLQTISGSLEARQHFNYVIRYSKLNRWIGMNHAKTYCRDFSQLLSWLNITVGCKDPSCDYIFKWMKDNKILLYVNEVLGHIEQLFLCTEENKKREILDNLKDSLSILAGKNSCPHSDFNISELCGQLSNKIADDLKKEIFKIDEYRILNNHPFFKMPIRTDMQQREYKLKFNGSQ